MSHISVIIEIHLQQKILEENGKTDCKPVLSALIDYQHISVIIMDNTCRLFTFKLFVWAGHDRLFKNKIAFNRIIHQIGGINIFFAFHVNRFKYTQFKNLSQLKKFFRHIFCQSVQTILILFYVIRHLFSPGLLLIHLLCLLLSPYKKTDT